MTWRDAQDLTAGLPAPRDDEPADLRRDIADELGDHLACAMQREQAHTDDDEAAKAAVLKRFGSPRTIARRLWWDAMKEKVMSQRLTLTAASVAMAACLGVAVLAWLTFQQTREVNLAIIAKLEALAAPQPVAAPQSLEWTEVRFRLVQENEDGPPAEGFQVVLHGNMINAGIENRMTLNEKVDSSGSVKFGPIRPGRYDYEVLSPWNHRTSGQLVALPGPKTEETVLCPGGPTPEGSVKFDLKWPEELKEALKEHKELDVQDVWVQCSFSRPGTQSKVKLGEHDWFMLRDSFAATMKSDGELVQAAELLAVEFYGGGRFAGMPGGVMGPMGRGSRGLPGGVGGRGVAFYIGGQSGPTKTTVELKETPTALVKWPVGDYTLMQIVLLSHETDPQNADREIVTEFAGHTFLSPEQPMLQVKADQENTWTIELPVIDLQPPPARGAAGLPGAARGRGGAGLPGGAATAPAPDKRPTEE